MPKLMSMWCIWMGKIKLVWMFCLWNSSLRQKRNILAALHFFHPSFLFFPLFLQSPPCLRITNGTWGRRDSSGCMSMCFQTFKHRFLKLRIFESTDICFPFSKFVFHPQWKCLPEDCEPLIRHTVSRSQELGLLLIGGVWCFEWIKTQGEIISTGTPALRTEACALQWALQHAMTQAVQFNSSQNVCERARSRKNAGFVKRM